MAEHHNIRGGACSATSVLIGYIAEATSTIRVGSRGRHDAESCAACDRRTVGTLDALYHGRSIWASDAPLVVIRRRLGLYAVRTTISNLDDSVLETIRLLSNFETSHTKLLQIVLAGQPQSKANSVPGRRPTISSLDEILAK